ncbi:MAG: hypothetical protein AAF564_20390 [Bacteroidota bacterium]
MTSAVDSSASGLVGRSVSIVAYTPRTSHLDVWSTPLKRGVWQGGIAMFFGESEVVRIKTRKPENPKTRKPENPKTRKPENPKTRKPENPKTRKPEI